jgi:hypothetical protein
MLRVGERAVLAHVRSSRGRGRAARAQAPVAPA